MNYKKLTNNVELCWEISVSESTSVLSVYNESELQCDKQSFILQVWEYFSKEVFAGSPEFLPKHFAIKEVNGEWFRVIDVNSAKQKVTWNKINGSFPDSKIAEKIAALVYEKGNREECVM
ncbi:hypothetical protein TUMSATVNIG1_60290 (plasmid) [Vibrio nigripulchritudo]|uniref:hypothetical protein n=1 Tax=Vibrio nigripulchritudo TaxID=28173 RepID=UPI00190C70D0|nr:hypothetical protein [Vibrio nigripulchritudo]BCL74043.1 hypothetical protein VNTUMSATTG_59800 [Vibrio nigripulchritudo]BDU35420.1 hypothetical protein TUMSATVNIG1_60290 [Vibrio nigripulchritudo]